MKLSVYIEQSFDKFVVSKTYHTKRLNRTTSVNGMERYKYEYVIAPGPAVSGSFDTIEQARTFIKENGLTETYGPHTVVSVDL